MSNATPEVDTAGLLDTLPDGVVVADATGTVTHLNATARQLLDAPTAQPGIGLADLMGLQDLQGRDWYHCIQPYGGVMARKRLVETSWHTASGREVLVTGTLHRIRPGGPVVRVSLAIRDSRSRQVVDRGRSDLVATVAHELRSPLTGVKGFTATLLSKWERFTESQKILMLRTVDADADRLTRLIAELLDVARIDSGRLSVRPEPTDLAEAVDGQMPSLATSTGRQMSVNLETRPKIWVDRDRLAQIVANLVENAVKHGNGDVWVSVRSTADGGAELIVDDAGRGIPESIRSRVFTKFWKHGQHGGSGLGLYIVGGLVAAHHGEVFVEQSPAGGARIRVVLPEGRPAVLDH